VTDYIESASYTLAKDKGYLTEKTTQEKHDRERLHLTTFFDMLSGTSIGGIIAAALVKPKNGTLEPEYYSKDAL